MANAKTKRSGDEETTAKKTTAKKSTVKKRSATNASATSASARKPPPREPSLNPVKPARLLSGGNPQVAKGEGDEPVQAYLAAMPGWKRDIGRRLDAIITRTVPKVRKAVKWTSPFYGIDGQGWFLGVHVFSKYVKIAFFRGAALKPIPPGTSKGKDTRYLDVYETDELDEKQIAAWVQQAASLPGWSASSQN